MERHSAHPETLKKSCLGPGWGTPNPAPANTYRIA